MEIAWLIVAALVLVIVVMAWMLISVRGDVGKTRSELEQTAKRANDAENRVESAERDRQAARDEASSLTGRLKEAETTRDAGGFDADRVYKLLGKSRLDTPDGQRTYGVVQENSGNIRPFLVKEVLDHLGEGDCFGVLRGKLAKLGEDEFKLESGTSPSAPSADGPRKAAASVTQMREAPQLDAGAEASAPTQKASQKTVLFKAPEPEEPEDPNKGMPYLAIRDGDEEQVHHLAFARVTAGRGDDNDIVLEDQSSSRTHFTVTFTANRFLLEDNDSTNGTLCNGETVARKWLEFGDRIEVGEITIRFSCEGYDLKDGDPAGAVVALESCVERQPDFIDALKLLAFMLERNVARKKEAASHWERIARLEASS